jgi:N-acetylglutamate synthase-like GNAT family acetyltransferase
VTSQQLRIRRATIDDLAALKAIWLSMRLPADALESRLTEFQVVDRGGEVVGAIGLQIVRTAALLHSEGYSDFSVADPARELFWERIQSLSSNHGVFRLWTQENSPFWRHWGFATASIEDLERLPDEWKPSEEPWFTLELKNEAVINAALKNQFAGYTAAEKKSAEEIQTRSKKVMTVITIFCFGIFFICLLVFFYLIKTRNPFQH